VLDLPYHLVYEPAAQPPFASPYLPWAIGIGGAIASLLKFRRFTVWSIVIATMFLGAGAFFGIMSRQADKALAKRYDEFRAASRDSTTPLVEGVGEEFHPAPYEGHADESFIVKGVAFSYSDYVITGGFNQTQSHGGPIRAGLHVRIRYVRLFGNTIVRLEVADSAKGAA
jgi:hypothetical protein